MATTPQKIARHNDRANELLTNLRKLTVLSRDIFGKERLATAEVKELIRLNGELRRFLEEASGLDQETTEIDAELDKFDVDILERIKSIDQVLEAPKPPPSLVEKAQAIIVNAFGSLDAIRDMDERAQQHLSNAELKLEQNKAIQSGVAITQLGEEKDQLKERILELEAEIVEKADAVYAIELETELAEKDARQDERILRARDIRIGELSSEVTELYGTVQDGRDEIARRKLEIEKLQGEPDDARKTGSRLKERI